MDSFIYTKLVIDMMTGEVLESEGYSYSGPVAEAKGATANQTALANSQTQFYNTLKTSFADTFSKQQAILDSLNKAFEPILAAGPGQYGFSDAEDRALRSQAIDQNAKSFAANEKALNNQLAARGGGNEFLPNGAEDQLQAENYNADAANESNALLGITQKGYDVGRKNWLNAAGILGKNAEISNPDAFMSGANNAGNSAFGSDTTIAKENAAASPWNTVEGILGGGLTAGVGNFFTKPSGKQSLATLPINIGTPDLSSLLPN